MCKEQDRRWIKRVPFYVSLIVSTVLFLVSFPTCIDFSIALSRGISAGIREEIAVSLAIFFTGAATLGCGRWFYWSWGKIRGKRGQ